jgi:serine/threonine-protein kinase
LRRCLTKDPKQRLRDIGEARIVIEDTLSGGADAGAAVVPAPTPARIWRRALPWGVTAILALALAGSLFWFTLRPVPRPTSPMRLSVEIGADAALDSTLAPAAALSRDGNTLAFAARPNKNGATHGNGDMSGVILTLRPSTGSPTQLFVRRLDHSEAAPLAGTENAYGPFFSPDDQWIGFFADGKLKKVSVMGGAVLTLCDAPTGRGGDWRSLAHPSLSSRESKVNRFTGADSLRFAQLGPCFTSPVKTQCRSQPYPG